jgi:hypothetical protein
MTAQVCTDCGSDSPDDATSNTLSRMGWRLHRYVNSSGALVFEWRCPSCWKSFKQKRTRISSRPPAATPAEAFARAARRLRSDPPEG